MPLMDFEATRRRYVEWVGGPEYEAQYWEENSWGFRMWAIMTLLVALSLVLCLPFGIYGVIYLVGGRRKKLREFREAANRMQCIPAYIVIANTALLRTKGATAPAMVVGSFEAPTPELHQALMDTTMLLSEAYGHEGTPTPEVAAVAHIMADDSYKEGHRDLAPKSVTGGHEIYAFNMMLESAHWGGGKLEIPFIAAMAEPGETGPIHMVPYWLLETSEGDGGAETPGRWAEQTPGAADVGYSDSGSPIIRYSEDAIAKPRPTAGDRTVIEAVNRHVELHFGDDVTVFHELLSDQVHVDVYLVRATPERRFQYLVTSGMSERAMRAPEGNEGCSYAELCLALPPEWPLTQEAFKDENNYWPVRWLKQLARFPHMFDSWLWWGHSMPNGDPAEPIANTAFNGFVLLQPGLAPDSFESLHMPDGREVWFLSPIPVYPEEMQLKLDQGSEVLAERLAGAGVSEYVIANRVNVAR